MTVANYITLVRLILVPVFIYFFAMGDRGTALFVFCVAGGSDLIDGTVARLLKQRSSWGAILDPMADKLLLESAFVCLVVVKMLPLWFLLLAFSRDLMITFGIIYFKIKKIDFPRKAIWTSKFATLFQIVTIILGLMLVWRADLTFAGQPFDVFMFYSMLIASALIVLSGALYIRMGLRLVRK